MQRFLYILLQMKVVISHVVSIYVYEVLLYNSYFVLLYVRLLLHLRVLVDYCRSNCREIADLKSDLDRQNYIQIYIRFTLHILVNHKQTLYILLIMHINVIDHNEKHLLLPELHFGRQAKTA